MCPATISPDDDGMPKSRYVPKFDERAWAPVRSHKCMGCVGRREFAHRNPLARIGERRFDLPEQFQRFELCLELPANQSVLLACTVAAIFLRTVLKGGSIRSGWL